MRQGSIYKRCAGCRRNVSDDKGTCAGCGRKLGRSSGTGWSWTFVVDVSAPGAPRKQRMRSGFPTRDVALAAMHDLQGEAKDGKVIEPSKLTVGQYLDRWLAGYKGEVKASSWSAAEGHVRTYITPRLGDQLLRALDRQTVKGFYVELRESGAVRPRKRDDGSEDRSLSPKTVHNVHLTLHRALEDAVADEIIRSNPAGSAGRGRAVHKTPPRASVETWTRDELVAFLDAAKTVRLAALFVLGAFTGMRRGELVGLRWRDLDLDAATVTVLRQRVKGEGGRVAEVEYGKSDRSRRTVDLDPSTVAALRDHRGRYLEHRAWLGLGKPGLDDLVFVGEDGQPLHPDTVSQTFDRLVKGIDVRRVTLHALRHSHATLMLAGGVALHVVSRRLGHASEAFTATTYAHVLPQQGAQAAATFAATINGD